MILKRIIFRPGKFLMIMGSLLLVLWFYSAFWPVTEAEVLDAKIYSLHQGGYAEGPYAQAYGGGSMNLSVAHYSYEIQDKTYNGKGLSRIKKMKFGDFRAIKISYFNLYPAFSFSSRGSLLFLGTVAIILGFGLMQVRFWAKSHLDIE